MTPEQLRTFAEDQQMDGSWQGDYPEEHPAWQAANEIEALKGKHPVTAVKALLESHKDILTGNAVSGEGRMYSDMQNDLVDLLNSLGVKHDFTKDTDNYNG